MLALFGALSALPIGSAHATPERAPPSGNVAHTERRLVSVKIAGDPVAVAAVIDVLRERGAAGDIETTFESVEAIDPASVVGPGLPNDRQLARIWIDLRESTGQANGRAPITLYVVDGPWERILVRPVVRHENAEITWEEIGHIVELAVGALRGGESIGVGRAVARAELLPPPSRDAPPAPPLASAAASPTVAPAPRTAHRWKVRGGGYYAVTAYGSGIELATGPGALLEIHTRVRKFEYGATLMAEYRFPSSVEREGVVVEFEGAAAQLLASGAFVVNDRHQLLLGIGGGLELVQAQASSIALDNVRFLSAFDTIPSTRLLARYAYTTSSLRLFAGVGVDVPLKQTRYFLSRENAPFVLLEPWFARPFVLIGIETN